VTSPHLTQESHFSKEKSPTRGHWRSYSVLITGKSDKIAIRRNSWHTHTASTKANNPNGNFPLSVVKAGKGDTYLLTLWLCRYRMLKCVEAAVIRPPDRGSTAHATGSHFSQFQKHPHWTERCTAKRSDVFCKSYNAALPFRDETSSDHVVPFAAIYCFWYHSFASYLVPTEHSNILQSTWYVWFVFVTHTHQYALTVPTTQTPDLLKEIRLILHCFRSSLATDSFGNIPVHGEVCRCTWRPHKMNAVSLVKVALVMAELCFTCLRRYQCIYVLKRKSFW
jgi:hypothetical protein